MFTILSFIAVMTANHPLPAFTPLTYAWGAFWCFFWLMASDYVLDFVCIVVFGLDERDWNFHDRH